MNTDPRYDLEVSYDLKSLSGFYENYEGLFRTQQYRYGPDLLPITNAPILGYESLGNFSRFPATAFRNITITGSRIHFSYYEIMKNVDPSKPGMLNRVYYFFISTFEKNGPARFFLGTSDSTDFSPPEYSNIVTPSSNETAELFGRQSVLLYNIESIIQSSFLADGKQTSSVETLYAIGATPDGESFCSTVQSTRSEGYLVADKNEWLQQMDAALTDANVLSAATAPPQDFLPKI